jgi:hypothetical protein
VKKKIYNKADLTREDLVSGGSKLPCILETIVQADILASFEIV